jgi:fructokinase
MKKHGRRKSRLDLPWDQEDGLFLKKGGPLVLGTGLIALDIVVTDRRGADPRYWAGGTCGNVLTILAYLGWRTYPVAALGEDVAAALVLEDLKRFGVKVRFLRRSTTRHTPIVVERIRTQGSGAPRHRFVWTCPTCGAWLPGYHAILASEAREIVRIIPTPTVFFFDRVSRGALDLAHASAERGALVIFEPSGIRDERLFREAVELSHIVKYSHERLGHLREVATYPSPLLEIETLGSEGLRYRSRDGFKDPSRLRWREIGAYPVRDLRDTAGAGDWCTAGLLHALVTRGATGLKEATEEEIEEALRFGQALAAVKCRYEGARGAMYALSKKKFEAAVIGSLNGDVPSRTEEEEDDSELGNFLKTICPSCKKRGRKKRDALK